MASLTVNGKPETVRGRCQPNLEQLFIRGYPVADRSVFQCECSNPIEHHYTQIGPPGATHWLCSL